MANNNLCANLHTSTAISLRHVLAVSIDPSISSVRSYSALDSRIPSYHRRVLSSKTPPGYHQVASSSPRATEDLGGTHAEIPSEPDGERGRLPWIPKALEAMALRYDTA